MADERKDGDQQQVRERVKDMGAGVLRAWGDQHNSTNKSYQAASSVKSESGAWTFFSIPL